MVLQRESFPAIELCSTGIGERIECSGMEITWGTWAGDKGKPQGKFN